MANFIASGQPGCFICTLFSYVFGDPHFTGFEGEHFDFHGVPDKFYNLLSDKDIQLNTYFRKWATSGDANFTVIETIGLKIEEEKLYFDINSLVKHNDEKVELPFTMKHFSVSKFTELPDEYKEHVNNPEFGKFIECYRVETEYYGFDFIVATDNFNPPYFNVSSWIKTDKRRPHGIIGQTADFDGQPRQATGNQGEGVIEGVYTDYEVSSLFADDFKFNKYKV